MGRTVSAKTLAHGGLRYSEVSARLARQISSGEIAPGTQLLGERDLSKRLGVSRVTLRRALAELRERGLLISDTARGWFVAKRDVGEPNALMSFTEMARSRGLSASSVIVSADVRPATLDEAEDLRAAPGSDIFEVERIRKLDGHAVALEQSRVPLKLLPSLPKADLASGSLYEALTRAGIIPSFANYTLQAIPATAGTASLLQIAAGTPLLMSTAITFDRSGRPIELSRSMFLGERYKFRTTLYRSRAGEFDR